MFPVVKLVRQLYDQSQQIDGNLSVLGQRTSAKCDIVSVAERIRC